MSSLLADLRIAIRLALALSAVGVYGLAALAAGRLLAAAAGGAVGVDALVVVAAGALLGGVALLAGLVPAHRAGKADPLIALRSE